MDRVAELKAIIAKYDLNNHPFYQDWRMGTLPTEKLRDYSGEYGRFVGTIAKGWETIDQRHYANEERYHETLWQGFKEELNFGQLSNYIQTEVLFQSATNLFSSEPEAIGALYAFEAQQPKTSQVKLEGLKEHYNFSEKGTKYFEVHADDFAEALFLERRLEDLSQSEFARAKSACNTLCVSMWGALDGIYYN